MGIDASPLVTTAQIVIEESLSVMLYEVCPKLTVVPVY